MKKLKEILQGIAFLFIGIPIMIMASIMDQRAFKKEKDQRQKENKRIPVPEHVEPEPQKRGFLSRFFLPNG